LVRSEAFWEHFGKLEARLRSARALLVDVWSRVEKKSEHGDELTTRDYSLIRLALNNVTEAGVEICSIGYRFAGGTSLRAGLLQRLYRDMMAGAQHITSSPTIMQHCGRELAGLAPNMRWGLMGLVPD
jgi:hypothetical protein